MPQSILTNTAIATAGRVVNVVLGVVVVGLLTRLLGPELYGSYALIVSIGITLQLVADVGLYLTLTRDISSDPDQVNHFVSTTTSLRLALVVVSLTVGGLLTVFIPQLIGLALPFYTIAVGLVAQSLSQLLMGVFQHEQTVWRATVADILGRGLQVGVIMWYASQPTLAVMALAFAASATLTYVCTVALLPRRLTWWPRVDTEAWKRLVVVSWPLGALLLLNAVYFRSDTLILSLFRERVEVGWYGLAYRVVESTLFFPAMLGGLLLPRLTESIRTQAASVSSKLVTEGLHVVTVVGVLGVIILLLRGTEVAVLLSGAAFAPSGQLLQILGVAMAVMFVGNIFGFTLIALQQQRQLLKLYAVLVVANLVANVLLIPLYGATAAALTTVATELGAVVGAGYLVHQHISYRFSALTVSLGTAGVATALVLLFASEMAIIPQLVIATGVYGSLLWVTKLFDRRHLGTLRG